MPSPGAVRTVPPIGMPQARGPLTERLLAALCRDPHPITWTVDDAIDDDDLQLALYCCYELHYCGLPGVDAEWEWEPSLLALRAGLEERFLTQLRQIVGPYPAEVDDAGAALWDLARTDAGPSLSRWVCEHATLDHLREFAIHRSAYQLKEADPHTWAIPRLRGAAKATLVAIQTDEYGNGVPAQMHSALFADTMTELGLDTRPNAYIDDLPGVTLATTNLISLFGLHRRWRGALVGHLALFEMTSTGPMSRYAKAFRRLGIGKDGYAFYDTHVEADRIHEQLAVDGMVAGLLAEEPSLAGDVLFGARALTAVESRFARHLLDRWRRGLSSLRGASDAVQLPA